MSPKNSRYRRAATWLIPVFYVHYLQASYHLETFSPEKVSYFLVVIAAIYLAMNVAQIYLLVRDRQAAAETGGKIVIESTIFVWVLANIPLIIFGSYRYPVIAFALLCVFALSRDGWMSLGRKTGKAIHPAQIVAWFCLALCFVGMKVTGEIDIDLLAYANSVISGEETAKIFFIEKALWWIALLCVAQGAMVLALILLGGKSRFRSMAPHAVYTFQLTACILAARLHWTLVVLGVFIFLLLRIANRWWVRNTLVLIE